MQMLSVSGQVEAEEDKVVVIQGKQEQGTKSRKLRARRRGGRDFVCPRTDRQEHTHRAKWKTDSMVKQTMGKSREGEDKDDKD